MSWFFGDANKYLLSDPNLLFTVLESFHTHKCIIVGAATAAAEAAAHGEGRAQIKRSLSNCYLPYWNGVSDEEMVLVALWILCVAITNEM